MKKILSLILAVSMAFSIVTPVFAAESTHISFSQQNDKSPDVKSSATFKLVPLSRETFWGEDGSCTLDYFDGFIEWTIKVPGVQVVSFEGDLYFNKLNTPFGSFNHSISATGRTGTEDVSYGLSKGKWEVEFSGIATGSNGNMYRVVDGAVLSFTVE